MPTNSLTKVDSFQLHKKKNMQLNPDGKMVEAHWTYVNSNLSLPVIKLVAFKEKQQISSGQANYKDPSLS